MSAPFDEPAMSTFRPVSYTHLDVYKRQGLVHHPVTFSAVQSGSRAVGVRVAVRVVQRVGGHLTVQVVHRGINVRQMCIRDRCYTVGVRLSATVDSCASFSSSDEACLLYTSTA